MSRVGAEDVISHIAERPPIGAAEHRVGAEDAMADIAERPSIGAAEQRRAERAAIGAEKLESHITEGCATGAGKGLRIAWGAFGR